MKLSIAWVFDHIDADWKKIDVPQLVHIFNQKVAEIEGFEKIHISLDPLTTAQITKITQDNITLFSSEWGQEFDLPVRKGAAVGQHYMIKKDSATIHWANAIDVGSQKDMLLPALSHDSKINAHWKQTFETHDYILELDNKSITHRPDMWGHRGFAREIAAMLDLPFKPLAQFLVEKKVTTYDESAPSIKTNPFSIRNEAPQTCKRIAGMYLDEITITPSLLSVAHRLARVDARAMDAIVDATNYVMLELGQPMHAFSASAFGPKQLVVRMAKNKEQLILLDGQTVELTSDDLVISDGATPLALAGVMGGQQSGVTANTTSILVESACFDAATIRKTAARHKKRTEASSRFEKSLDPNQNVTAITRFLKLLQDADITYHASDEIFSLGPTAQIFSITITHETIETRLGVTLAPDFIIKILSALEFGVQLHDNTYTITIPTFRSTKDVKIKEDIIEEVGRYYGYTTLQTQLPKLALKPSLDNEWVYQQRKIKQTLAFACSMRELYAYAFFDEEFLTTIQWQPSHTLEVQSPVSANWRRVVTTLLPNLLKSVVTNSSEHDTLRFFELARVWQHTTMTLEKKSLAGIFYDKKGINFYDAKAELQKLFEVLKISIEWVKVEQPEHPWFAPYQTAYLMCNDTRIGIAGSLHPTFLSSVMQGSAWMFELDADFLLHYKASSMHFIAPSKYPEMIRDISVLISIDITADAACHMVAQVDPKISAVSLIDFFQKDEWPDKRAMTLRFVITDNERTMTKEEADVIWERVATELKNVGATIR